MPYSALRLAPCCPATVQSFVRESVELILRDVHTMFRLPQRDDGLQAACNLSIASLLLNVISGVSTVLYSATGPTRGRFGGCLRQYYPWALEHDYRRYEECVKPQPASAILYDLFRNPFAHALGLDTEIVGGDRKSVTVIRKVRSKPFRIGVARIVQIGSGLGLTPQALQEIETGRFRPDWLPCTIESEKDGYTLSTEALYCGVRRLVETLSSDPERMQHASDFLG